MANDTPQPHQDPVLAFKPLTDFQQQFWDSYIERLRQHAVTVLESIKPESPASFLARTAEARDQS